MTDILSVCIEAVRKALDPDNERDDLDITEFSHLENDLGVDSPDYLQIVLLIKGALKIPHDQDKKCGLDRHLCRVNDLRDYFEEVVAARQSEIVTA